MSKKLYGGHFEFRGGEFQIISKTTGRLEQALKKAYYQCRRGTDYQHLSWKKFDEEWGEVSRYDIELDKVILL